MTKLNEVYKCEICGNIVTVLHEGAGELVCCGKPMVLQQEKVEEEVSLQSLCDESWVCERGFCQ